MQLAAEVLHESSSGILEIRHQRITGFLHPGRKLYPAAEGGRRLIAQISPIFEHSEAVGTISQNPKEWRRRNGGERVTHVLSFIMRKVGA
jgi:hypothetical protein